MSFHLINRTDCEEWWINVCSMVFSCHSFTFLIFFPFKKRIYEHWATKFKLWCVVYHQPPNGYLFHDKLCFHCDRTRWLNVLWSVTFSTINDKSVFEKVAPKREILNWTWEKNLSFLKPQSEKAYSFATFSVRSHIISATSC